MHPPTRKERKKKKNRKEGFQIIIFWDSRSAVGQANERCAKVNDVFSHKHTTHAIVLACIVLYSVTSIISYSKLTAEIGFECDWSMGNKAGMRM